MDDQTEEVKALQAILEQVSFDLGASTTLSTPWSEEIAPIREVITALSDDIAKYLREHS